MVAQKYRWDFIGLSTDEKPTASTSPKVTDGSTYYCSDNSKLYVWYKNQWYERKPLGGGGGGGGSYTAGTGIDITDDTISVDTTTIQAKLTAGDNITITDDTISATDTTYSAFTGTDGTSAGAAGLVPAPATTDAGKFLKADGTWDEAGSSINVVQTTGTSTTDVMSQNAVTSMVFADPSTKEKVQIGSGAQGNGSDAIAIGHTAVAIDPSTISIGKGRAKESGAISIGNHSTSTAGASAVGSIALGYGASASDIGVMSINTNNTAYGYHSSNYRLLTGLYDGQSAHDAVTVGQITPTTDSSAPTSSTAGRLGEIRIDTTDNSAYMCVVSDSVTPTYEWKKITA